MSVLVFLATVFGYAAFLWWIDHYGALGRDVLGQKVPR